jgi:hypothetical protein
VATVNPSPALPDRQIFGWTLEERVQRVVCVDAILYLFVAAVLRATDRRDSLIDAPWAAPERFRGHHVYIRTAEEVLWTKWENIAAALRHLTACGLRFDLMNRGVAANVGIPFIPELDSRFGRKRIGFDLRYGAFGAPLTERGTGKPSSRTEWIAVSDRARRRLNRRFAGAGR